MAFRGLDNGGSGNGGVSWLRKWREAVIKRIVDGLKWRLGIHGYDDKFGAFEAQLRVLDRSVSTWAVSHWIEHATLEKSPLVSVILPTHNRSGLLQRAVASVVAQEYQHWEIIVIDDGSSDDTAAAVERLKNELGEKKLVALRVAHSGVCAARNRGLDAARGEIISYLDDDNRMHRLWLKAVVWAFSQRPEVDVVYGGIIIDDILRVNRKSRGGLPSYYLHAFDRRSLMSGNLADIGAIAHRSGIADAHFDESLREMGDWDLLLRITRVKPPLVLPVLACLYSTEESDRLSGGATFDADAARVREKAEQ
jgi:hypothetical protein